MTSNDYPVAEIFSSLQGEGYWAGTPMVFVRLAGCPVGKPYSRDVAEFMHLAPYQDRCQMWEGSAFPCDTNYQRKEILSIEQIVEQVQRLQQWPNNTRPRMCLTGGEPTAHKIWPLMLALWQAGYSIHLETSGTTEEMPLATPGSLWVTVSPKWNYKQHWMRRADELKFLVDGRFDETRFQLEMGAYLNGGRLIYLQPVNDAHTINQQNVDHCKRLLERWPQCRLSVQLHKIIGVR
jgi:7-carboxy-7-deazaguanine synthase